MIKEMEYAVLGRSSVAMDAHPPVTIRASAIQAGGPSGLRPTNVL